MHHENITSAPAATMRMARAVRVVPNEIPAVFRRFTIAIARAHERGDGRRVDRLLAAKVHTVRRFHGLRADGRRVDAAKGAR
jgi:hypothetical protein